MSVAELSMAKMSWPKRPWPKCPSTVHIYVLLKFSCVKKVQENAQAKLLTTSTVLCKQCFKKIEPRIFCKITFFKFRSTENKIFLENPHKEFNVSLPDILFSSACFRCSGAYFCWWGFSKNYHIL